MDRRSNIDPRINESQDFLKATSHGKHLVHKANFRVLVEAFVDWSALCKGAKVLNDGLLDASADGAGVIATLLARNVVHYLRYERPLCHIFPMVARVTEGEEGPKRVQAPKGWAAQRCGGLYFCAESFASSTCVVTISSHGQPTMIERKCARSHSNLACYYNAIAHIDRQRRSASPVALQRLAELFVRHGVHNCFGISLLHRHRSIALGSVIVHTRDGPDTDICVEEELGLREISPCLFLSHTRDEFLPVEYEAPSRTPAEYLPSIAFLLELGSFLWDQELQEVFGLCRVSSLEDPWIEKLLGDEGNTIATRSQRSISVLDGTITQWAFLCDQRGDVSIKSVRACKETESGGHVRT